MKSRLRTLFFLLTSLYACVFHVYASKAISPYTKATNTENYLKEKGYDFQKIPVVSEFIGKFPSNITIDIPSVSTSKERHDSDTIDRVIFAFTQDFFLEDPEFIESFIETTKENELPYDCTILLSTDSETTNLDVPGDNLNGTDYYAERLYESDTTCAFIIHDDSYSSPQINSAAAGVMSPMWIVRSAEYAFHANQKSIAVQNGLLYGHLGGIFKEDKRLASFKRNDITSCAIPLGHTKTDLAILSTLQKDISNTRIQGGNIHYNNITSGRFSIWLNESLLTVIYLSFAVLVLISLCFSSFKSNAKNEAILKDLSRTWFFTPAYLLLTALALWIFQGIFSGTKINPLVHFSLKTLFCIVLLFSIAFIQKFYRFRISLSSISFITIIVSALNIFIFTFLDLSLMFVFIIEYIIVYLSRRTSNKYIALATLVFMTMPLIQPSVSLYINTNHDKLVSIFTTGFAGNILYAFVIMPFVFQWSRCTLLMNLKDEMSAGNKTKALVSGIIISCLAASLIFFVFAGGTKTIASRFDSEKQPVAIEVTETTEPLVKIKYSTSDNFDLITHKLEISSTSEREILRCNLTLSSEMSTPVYECNYNYSMKSAKEAVVEIPDGFDGDLTVMFSSDYGTPVHAVLEFYIMADDTHALRETREIDLTGKLSDGKAI